MPNIVVNVAPTKGLLSFIKFSYETHALKK